MLIDFTEKELLAMARGLARWLDQYILDDYWGGPLENADPSEAEGRLQRIAELVGAEAVRQVRNEVREESRCWDGCEVWDVMESNDDELRWRMEQHYAEEREHIRHKAQDKETQQQAFEYLRDNPWAYQLDDSGDLWSFRRFRDGRQLELTVRTVGGSERSFPEYSILAPRGWQSPFGLH